MDSLSGNGILSAFPGLMKPISKAALCGCSVVFLGLASCGAVSKVGQNSVAFVQKSTASAGSKVSQWSQLASNAVSPAGIKVVEVREKDLKKQPTGQEQAVAFQSTRRRSWFFGGPVDFQEPMLPVDASAADGSLLPTVVLPEGSQ